MRPHPLSAACLLAALVLLAVPTGAAAQYSGLVTFGGLPVPGATATATRVEQTLVALTGADGVFHLTEVREGVWTIRVDMPGFTPLTREVTIASSAPSPWELTLLSVDELLRTAAAAPSDAGRAVPRSTVADAPETAAPSAPSPPPPAAPSAPPASSSPTAPPPAAIDPAALPSLIDEPAGDGSDAAREGLLINGSVNNAAASRFAQPAAFGNNRPGRRAPYSWSFTTLLGNSALDARPFSFGGAPAPKPAYQNVQTSATFAGAVRLPRVRNRANVFVGFERLDDNRVDAQAAVMPSALERRGDFSQTRDGFGRPVAIANPATGTPFAGNIIPESRLSREAVQLLNRFPLPNTGAGGRYNYQIPALTARRQDSLQTRVTQPIDGNDQVRGSVLYQRTRTHAADVFSFVDRRGASLFEGTTDWTHGFSRFVSLRVRYGFTRLASDVMPHFAGRENVSGDAGIRGNDQDPVNWGPPNLVFSTIESLTSAQYAADVHRAHAWSAETVWNVGRHTLTFGGDVRRQRWEVFSQQDARGTFAFSGAASGSDLADFLLGIPQTISIAAGNPDKDLRAPVYDAYVADDWRLSPTFTVNAGIRWEYEAPLTERLGRLVNLDIAPGFSAVTPVLASRPNGAPAGERYPASLVRPDWRGVQPRVGIAWRPIPASSLVLRAGYGIYRNTSVYFPIAMLMAQQPPLSTTLSVENRGPTPATLADGFTVPAGPTANTFAIDPDFRVGFVQHWQASAQRDLPASLAVTATYLGTAGSRLMQAFLPNTYPAGAPDPCPECPHGFVYLTSNGSSVRHAAQVELRRRLASGFAANVRYTLSKATDDAAAAFAGGLLRPAAIAQNWLDLEAERAPSVFDQRHAVTAQVEYTTGMGLGGGTLTDGIKGSLLKGWTFTSALTTGSGLPWTPVYLTSVAGTGVTGTLRPDPTGAPLESTAPGAYANPGAFAPPAPGRWGVVERNSLTGPRQFLLHAAVQRTLHVADRVNVDWRIEAANVLNRVTYANVYPVIGATQFGLPSRANPMRKIQLVLRVRFNVDRPLSAGQ